MKHVLISILKKKKKYADLPFFYFLSNEDFSPRQRIAFYPGMAYFILAFGDLNKYVMRKTPEPGETIVDVYQEMVNAHTLEDDHHWPWYLEDYTKLGFDKLMPMTELLAQLFSDEAQANRRLMYKLTQMIGTSDNLQRLAIIEAIEETGTVLFSLLNKIAKPLEQEIGEQLRYCGDHHFHLETGHAMNGEHAILAGIEMTPAQIDTAEENVAAVFSAFSDWTDELLKYALANMRDQTMLRPPVRNAFAA